jgi:acyl-CoA reductase-like NAD-dependent aldehyde dehydrogenase
MPSSVVVDGNLRHLCPVDLHPLPPVRVSSAEDVRAAVKAARAAQAQWAAMGFDARAKALKQATRLMLERRQQVLELLHDETGKVAPEVLMGEALGPLQYVSDWVGVAKGHLKPKRIGLNPIAWPGKSATLELLPRGVVGIIAPWNFPLANFFKPVFAALLCGNAVVLKPSEYSPRMGAWFVNVLSEVLPKNVIQVVQGDRETGQALITAGIDALTFTGSSSSGKSVAKACAEQLIPVSLELGGKDAAIVLADCDLDRTVAGVMYWALSNAGQACGAIERVFVEDVIADRFVERLGGAVSQLRFGEPQSSDVGPLANEAQLSVVERQVADALAKGATLVCGGRRTGKGYGYEPTVLDHCTSAMEVLREPTFGPVIALSRVSGPSEALERANDCDYGLSASIWSSDLTRAKRLARKLEVGTAFVNNHGFTGAIPSLPWTGVKKSGAGVANSSIALHHYTRPRSVVVDTNSKADAWWFPYDEQLADLGHRLADAQVGKVLGALKVPMMIAARQKQVLRFARDGAQKARRGGGLNLKPGLEKITGVVKRVAEMTARFAPPLTERERAWGKAAMDAVFPSEGTPLEELSQEQWGRFLNEFYESMPFPANLGIRAAIAATGLAPVVLRRKLETLEQLAPEEREQVMAELANSDAYFWRQITLLLKTTGGMAVLGTTRFHDAVKPKPPAPKARA